MDWAQARFNMVEQQIRPWEVLDETVLNLLFEVKRENFIPANWRDLAFVDMETPIKQGVTTLPPKMEARLLQELHIGATDKVLEIGTGCGYLTALLARLARHVYSVDIDPELTELARGNLSRADIRNVTLETGDAAQGWNSRAPYDVIVVTASLPVLPDSLLSQLNPGGRLFAIVGDAPVMVASVMSKDGAGTVSRRVLFDTQTAPLQNAAQPQRFSF
ncbi:protein-L-isoaspartate O-methyltransferase family protein [Leeia aquatica]|uniref:Protein-L-isoaspartate O-methyltransferase n=1 Tax=Leeia aquatica TaxID=2725557 RepID=A0A847SH77_9NEIS|nr:protein-L-isoaspartate O-methyltransferase [Leeia aquatica]NLR76638.1 protein-L-isoaspartate O-methyltransferase [Leeia aquatica]